MPNWNRATTLPLSWTPKRSRPPGLKKETDDIYFSADEMIDNKDMQTITAVGDVNIIRKDQTLKADKVIYNQKDDIVTAVGNVSIVQADGTVVFPTMSNLTTK